MLGRYGTEVKASTAELSLGRADEGVRPYMVIFRTTLP